MSTYQPPGGQPPEGTPSYAQPQDPWSGGFDQGLASVPTDPIPQQYDPYAQGVSQGDVWSQETAPHGGQQYGYAPAPPKRKVGLIIAVFLAVLVLGGGGGFAAWYVTTHQTASPDPTTSPTTPPTSAAVDNNTCVKANGFDPCALAVGDCFVNNGTTNSPDLKLVECTTPKSFKVVKVSAGAGIPEGPDGKFDADTTSVSECKDVKFTQWYGYKDGGSDEKDHFFCLTENK